MQRRTWIGVGLVLVGVAIGTTIHHFGRSPIADSYAQGADNKPYLLHVAGSQRPNDTGTNATTFAIEDFPQLGGKSLRVNLASSFGDTPTRVTNWKPFSILAFNVFNPGTDSIKSALNIAHRDSKDYETRIEVILNLKSGKNEFRINLPSLTNTNGSVPDLVHVERWYIAKQQDGPVPTVYFSDFWFELAEPTPTPAPSVPAPTPTPSVVEKAPPAAGFYQIKGKIGTMEVDLIVSPLGTPPPQTSQAPLTIQTPAKVADARLARIRSAVMPRIEKAIMFDTPDADAIASALEIMPPNNPWNLNIENWPLHPNSRNIITAMGATKPLRYSADMAYVFVPTSQKKIDIKIVGYPEETDRGPYPIPDNTPIEGWPVAFQTDKFRQLTLDDVQRDRANIGGDRHAIVVDPFNRKLYEFYAMKKTAQGWQASQASIFDLASNKLRPDGWTSSDAAGLPIFPAIIRYDELERGIVEHAIRVTFEKTRKAYVYPATHYASKITDENVPRMGERFRLKRTFDIKSFSRPVQAILKGLQKHGMLVADNGMDWMISIAPDPRIPMIHEELRRLKGSDFEVIVAPAE